MVPTTEQALSAITDEGLFERLATAILREADPAYHRLTHPGVNLDGRTVKSPLDGMCFRQGANPPHLVAVHHTITGRSRLEKKWLHDPSTVTPRTKGKSSTSLAGDVIKTGKLVAEERMRIPNLKATLVLTTNQEPDEELVRLVEATALRLGLEIDIWTRSRLVHELDVRPTGQWLRFKFLGIEQEQLSPELLRDLSQKSLDIHAPPDNPDAWISRSLDETLRNGPRGNVSFLVADSGLGKTVACHRWLSEHANIGGFSIVLSHQTIATAQTLDQALLAELKKIHTPLAIANASALAISSPEQPIFAVVEDINRSGQAAVLLEKLVGWCSREKQAPGFSNWRLICPLWPDVISSLRDDAKKQIGPLLLSASTFSEEEGTGAVMARARTAGRDMTELAALAISQALGHDPLLIALYDPAHQPDPHLVIKQFIEGAIGRASSQTPEHPAADYRRALRALAANMLRYRKLEINWVQVRNWAEIPSDMIQLLSRLAHRGELIRLTGTSDDQQLTFRHDRVREYLLVDAAIDLERQQQLDDDIVGEPYFAEVIGAVLAQEEATLKFLARVATANPLALFQALRLLGSKPSSKLAAILNAIENWLDDPLTHSLSKVHLRWEAIAKLAETDCSRVPDIVRRFSDRTFSGQAARFRNGDITGGIELCITLAPGTTSVWRDLQISHAKQRYGAQLAKVLAKFLSQSGLNPVAIKGALRLAGHIADPELGAAIETCWLADQGRDERLADYLWAAAQCCGNDPARYLAPICNAWALLPLSDGIDRTSSPRDELAANQLRWAFRHWPPANAIDYFVQRAAQEDLQFPITIMLNGFDHPTALLFMVEQLAEIRRRIANTSSISPFLHHAEDEWRRDERSMSNECRDLLLNIWQDNGKERYIRIQSFALWAATRTSYDLPLLQRAQESEADENMVNRILRARLDRSDSTAIPALLQNLEDEEKWHWWYQARHVWSPDLASALDEHLARWSKEDGAVEWGTSKNFDSIVSEIIMEAPQPESENLLLKYWPCLRYRPGFVQAALYIASPRTIAAAEAALAECPEPAKLLEHISMHMGIKTYGRPGLTREEQIQALKPYAHLLSFHDRYSFWELCNDRGWWQLRREVLDIAMQEEWAENKWRGMWEPSRAWIELDDTIAYNRATWLDHWIDDYIQAGVPWPDILSTMKSWLDNRRTLESFQLVAAAVRHRGMRKDLDGLAHYEDISQLQIKDIIEDTRFAVCRRQIS